MTENAKQPSKRLTYAILWTLVFLIAIPSLYVLSIGPAFGLAARGWISNAAKDAYASPVRATLQNHPRSAIVQILDTYIGLWMP